MILDQMLIKKRKKQKMLPLIRVIFNDLLQNVKLGERIFAIRIKPNSKDYYQKSHLTLTNHFRSTESKRYD